MEINRVAVIMPCYNAKKTIKRAINSVLNQTYLNFELIIIDDHSSDNTTLMISEYTDKRIKLIKNKKNFGVAFTRNIGLKHSSSQYIAFIDDDDYWLPTKLQQQIEFMKENDYSFSCTSYFAISNNKKIRRFNPSLKNSYINVLFYNPLCNSTVMYDCKRLGLIQIPDILKRNDYALWLKMLKVTKYCYGLNIPLTYYQKNSSGSLSSNKFSLVKYHWYIYRKLERISIFLSLLLIFNWILIKLLKIK